MSATTTAPAAARFERTAPPPLARAEGVELLGDVEDSGYRSGMCLVRRADGQVVRVGPLMHALLAAADGRRDADALARAVSEQIGRQVDRDQVARLAEKLGEQGLIAGTEGSAPPRRNPLLALRWRVLVTDPAVTNR